MNEKRFIVKSLKPLFLIVCILIMPLTARAESDVENLLPVVACGAGWNIEGKPALYDRESLSDRINGEAELYFPYGFDRLAAARFAPEKNPVTGMDVEIYRMGSLLDAFGMYANYRQKDGTTLEIGAESNVSDSQIFFYQGRYFVHIQMTGTSSAAPHALAGCARMVAARLPGNKDRPPELLVFDRPEVVKGTERYLPQSLLGYDFLNRGIMADAIVEGKNLQMFLLLRTASGSASRVFDRYRSQLAQWKIEPGEKDASFLEGDDPLYGPVIIFRRGECLAGALRFSEKKGIRAVLDSLCR